MNLLPWILALDALVLIAISVAGGIAEARAARARRRAEEADWALLYSWLRQPLPPGARDASSQT
jgi:hypothetical protein